MLYRQFAIFFILFFTSFFSHYIRIIDKSFNVKLTVRIIMSTKLYMVISICDAFTYSYCRLLLTLSRFSLKFSKWSEKSNISVIRRMRAILPSSVHCLKSCNISVDNKQLMSTSKFGVTICWGIFHI